MAYQGQQQHSWNSCEEPRQTERQHWQEGKKASNDPSSLPAFETLNSVWPSSSSNVSARRSQSSMADTVHQALPPVPQRAQKLRYNVVLATGRIFGFSQPLELNSLDSGGLMIREIRRVYYQQLTTRWMRFRLLGISCRRVQIETGAIEINGSNPQVIILNSEYQELLTEAFLHPKLIHNHTNLVFPSPEQAIVLRPIFDKTRFIYLLIFVLAVAPILGVLTAWYIGQVDTGIDVCVGLYTLMTAVQAVAFWAR